MLNVRRSKTACFLGNTEDEYEIYKAVDDAISLGYENFLFWAENESGILFAKQVILRKKKQTGNKPDKIILTAVVSDERHADNKDEVFRDEYFSVIEKCDFFVDLKNTELCSCEKFMISKSSKTI